MPSADVAFSVSALSLGARTPSSLDVFIVDSLSTIEFQNETLDSFYPARRVRKRLCVSSTALGSSRNISDENRTGHAVVYSFVELNNCV